MLPAHGRMTNMTATPGIPVMRATTYHIGVLVAHFGHFFYSSMISDGGSLCEETVQNRFVFPLCQHVFGYKPTAAC